MKSSNPVKKLGITIAMASYNEENAIVEMINSTFIASNFLVIVKLNFTFLPTKVLLR